MKNIFSIMAILSACVAFSACVDINLKSELPKIEYYELDNINANATHCEAFNLIALEAIDIPQSFAGKNIFYKNGNRIMKVDGINLNENLKNSIESMLIKSFSNHCLKIITPPFSGIKLEQYLRIKMLTFNAIKGDSSGGDSYKNDFAKGDSSDSNGSGFAGDSSDSNDSSDSSDSSDSARADNIARVSFMFVLHQNGTILQSGIITQDFAIKTFNAENIFNALQNATNKAIQELTNKFIPK